MHISIHTVDNYLLITQAPELDKCYTMTNICIHCQIYKCHTTLFAFKQVFTIYILHKK